MFYRESAGGLNEATRDVHRAIILLQEELAAIDSYDQRAAVRTEPELKSALGHGYDEEKEHAAMLIAWLRRRRLVFDKELRNVLFTDDASTHG